MKFSTLIVTLLLQYTKSSFVIDSISQRGVYLSEYCPKAEYCPEGAHVMCMYYNPHHVMGPRCYRPKNVSMTPALAETWLELTNAVRSKIALGTEKGKGGVLLPRGYGMIKLKWDNELATFAQVLANQCVLKHDLCRATKKFPDPGQTAGQVRFTNPDWIPVSKNGHFTKPGLTMSKLKYAITQAMRTWYKQKDDVTPEFLSSYSDWAKVSREAQEGRLYMEMIYAPTTHMGCGMSAYSQYAYYDNNAALNYNVVQVICNYSARPRHGVAVYRTDPPTEAGYTVRCGCPIGMDEDEDCLCIKGLNEPNAIESSCARTGHCKPAVVLLPIFTVEDAPPDKLIARSGFNPMPQLNKNDFEVEISDLYSNDNTSILHTSAINPQTNIQHVLSNIINDGYSKNKQQTSLINSLTMDTHLPASDWPNKSTRFGYSHLRGKEPHSVISSLVDETRRDVDFRVTTSHKPLILDVKKRLFGKHPTQLGFHNLKTIRPTFNSFKPRKKSVFAKVATFELPKTGEVSIKPDVQPRKDFSSIKNLALDYLNFKKGIQDHRKIFSLHDHPSETTTERFLNSAEEKVINYNYYLKNVTQSSKNPSKSLFGFDTNFSKENSNDKLMTLLDRLEQEVKHIELDRNKKEIFDAKIRKIYGTVVGESAPLHFKTDHVSDFTDGELTDFDRYESELKRHSDVEGKNHIQKARRKNGLEELQKTVENIHDKYSAFENERRPISRSQNSLYAGQLNALDQRNIIKTKDGYDSDMKHRYSDVEEIRANLHKSIFSGGNDIKSDHIQSDNEVLRARHVYSDNEDKKQKYLEKRQFHIEDDPLGIDRRRYYQSRLEHLERKLHNTRRHHEDNNNRQLRPVLPTRNEQPLRPSKNQPDTFYMPDRARFLHGF